MDQYLHTYHVLYSYHPSHIWITYIFYTHMCIYTYIYKYNHMCISSVIKLWRAENLSSFSAEENVSKVDVWERVKHLNLHALSGKLEIIFKPFINHLNPSLGEVILLIIPNSISCWSVIFNWVMRVLKIEAFHRPFFTKNSLPWKAQKYVIPTRLDWLRVLVLKILFS